MESARNNHNINTLTPHLKFLEIHLNEKVDYLNNYQIYEVIVKRKFYLIDLNCILLMIVSIILSLLLSIYATIIFDYWYMILGYLLFISLIHASFIIFSRYILINDNEIKYYKRRIKVSDIDKIEVNKETNNCCLITITTKHTNKIIFQGYQSIIASKKDILKTEKIVDELNKFLI